MSKPSEIIEIARRLGVISLREVAKRGFHKENVYRLCAKGLLVRVGRGLYEVPGGPAGSHHDIVQAIQEIPRGVICLISALRVHGIGTQIPRQVWVALPEKAYRPRTTPVPVRTVRFSGRAFSEGVVERELEGVQVKVYGVAKTVADCFKYRTKIGLDVALEALREVRQQRMCTNDDLWHYAKMRHVDRVMKPYMEVIG